MQFSLSVTSMFDIACVMAFRDLSSGVGMQMDAELHKHCPEAKEA